MAKKNKNMIAGGVFSERGISGQTGKVCRAFWLAKMPFDQKSKNEVISLLNMNN